MGIRDLTFHTMSGVCQHHLKHLERSIVAEAYSTRNIKALRLSARSLGIDKAFICLDRLKDLQG
jgi:hypothetical protein